MNPRLEKLASRLAHRGVTHFLTMHPPHVRYLSGFTGSNGVLIVSGNGVSFVTDGRYEEQASQEVKDAKIYVAPGSNVTLDQIFEHRLLPGGSRVGFESAWVTYGTYELFAQRLDGVELVPLTHVVEPILIVKDEDEIARLRKAVEITERVFEETLPIVRPGVTERELAGHIAYLIRQHGGEKESFDTIVASGWRGALPHGRPSDKELRAGELVIFDLGAIYEGYHGDMTRTVCIGEPSPIQRRVYDIVREAHERAVQKARAGVRAHDVDAAARSYITEQGYGPSFNHGLGHGIGLDIHEAPRLGPDIEYRLEADNVVTIEPGIYIPRAFGVRIENDYRITAGGCENLMRTSADLICV
jgi:Xaa-Pro aminopeptidase